MLRKFHSNLRGHALTSFDGVFLDADRTFCEIVGSDIALLRQRTILDITHDKDRIPNHDKLERLRRDGEPFEITKRYVRPDGTFVMVNNHVSRFQDGCGAPCMVASVEAVTGLGENISERELLEIASILQKDMVTCSQKTVKDDLDRKGWGLMLTVYVLEQQGSATTLSRVCKMAGIIEAEGYLTFLELLADGWLSLDHKGHDLHDSSALLTSKARRVIADYLKTLTDRIK